MKVKILILGLIFLFFIVCGNLENPYSPKPPEQKQAKLEFNGDPYLHCPTYNLLLEYQEVRLSYKVMNTGNAVYNISYFYIDLRLYDPTPLTLLFAACFIVNIPAGEIVVGGSQEGTILFDMKTEIWNKYLSGEVYKILKIVLGNAN